jgi:hypothetical protein
MAAYVLDKHKQTSGIMESPQRYLPIQQTTGNQKQGRK